MNVINAISLAENFRELSNKIPEVLDGAIDAALDELEAQIKNRIFTKNEDVDGNKFGKYKSEAYKKFRKSIGRDINNKDLQVNLNLRRSIVKDLPNKSIIFNQNRYALIGEGQERQMRKKIFEADEVELKLALEVIEDFLTEKQKEIIDGN